MRRRAETQKLDYTDYGRYGKLITSHSTPYLYYILILRVMIEI